MVNEYLFLSDEYLLEIESYKPTGVTVELTNIENSLLWRIAYSLPKNDEKSANNLSEVHTYVMNYSPLILTCESSEYYNRTLFPIINKLERKLRKLLYLAASISDNQQAKVNIKQLEEKDFGEIFELLFIDRNFIIEMKKRINADGNSVFKGMSQFSKKEIEVYLGTLKENTLWDNILSEGDVPALRAQFREVQNYRNSVMHAHNINKAQFGKARYLFNKINEELDSAINRLMNIREEDFNLQEKDINTAIFSALTEQLKISQFYTAIESFNLLTEKLNMAIQQMSEAYSEPLEVFQKKLNLTIKEFQGNIRKDGGPEDARDEE